MPEENPTIPIKQLVENDSRFYPLTSANAVFFEDSSYLSSKPFATGVLTINLNGSQAGTFSANGANNQTINIQAASAANLLSLVASASYNSNTKKIEFFNTASTKLCDIDASAFIKDGMIDSISIGNGTGANASKSCLLIDFNTDAESGGHTDIEIPLEGIFNPANYYTKTETDSTFVAQTDYDDDSEVVAAALNDLNGRLVTLEAAGSGDENVIETVKVNGTALTVTNKAVNITVPTTLASLTDDSTHRLVTDTEKTKLQGIAAGAEVNVQSDWSVTDSTSDAYIANKPTIPTVTSTYSSTGTDAVNGTAVASALSSYVTNTEFNNDARVVSAALNDLNDRLVDAEDTSNKVTSLSSSSTDTEYPSAKAVYDAIQNSGEWRLIKHDTLSSASNIIVIYNDSNNNPFALSNVLVYIKLSTSPSTGTTAMISYRNSDQSVTYAMPLVYTPYSSGTTYDMRGINQVRVLDGIIMPVLALTSYSDSDNRMANFEETGTYYNVPIALDSVEYIQILSYVNNGFPSGTEYYIWGY